MTRKEIKSLWMATLVSILLLCLTGLATIGTAQSSDNVQGSNNVQSAYVSVGPGKLISWDNIPKGIKNPTTQKYKEMPIGRIGIQNKGKAIPPTINVNPSQDIDQYQQTLQPTKISSWEGLNNTANVLINGYIVRPPDPIIAAGPNYVGTMVNDVLAFYTKSGGLAGAVGLDNWYGAVNCFGCFITDPRIEYDHNEGHWSAVALGIDPSTSPYTSYYLLSVSQTSNPFGNWFFYGIPSNLVAFGTNTWSDYPDIGFDGINSASKGAIYVTSNQFDGVGNYITASLSVLPKSKLYTGAGFSFTRFSGMMNANGFPADTLRASQTFGNPGAEYVVNSENDGAGYDNNVTLWKVNPQVSPVSLTHVNIPIGSFNPPPRAQQNGGNHIYFLDTIDNRAYNAVYRNGSVYTAFNEANNFGNGTVSSIRYLKLNTTTNKPVLNVKYGADKNFYWFPAITVDGANNIDIVFAYSSPTDYAGIRYTARKTTDTTTEPSAILKSGQVTIQGYRWGDYFGIAKDPTDNSIWIYGEYAKTLSGFDKVWEWGTYVGRIKN